MRLNEQIKEFVKDQVKDFEVNGNLMDYVKERINDFELNGWRVYIKLIDDNKIIPSELRVDNERKLAYIYVNPLYIEKYQYKDIIDCHFVRVALIEPIIETPRLIIRHFVEDDFYDYFCYSKKPQVQCPQGSRVNESYDEARYALNGLIGSNFNFALYSKEENRVIGNVCLVPSNKAVISFNIGYGIDDTFWHQGYATEMGKAMLTYAFKCLGAGLVDVSVYDENIASKKTIEKLGFKYEGFLRKGFFDQNVGPKDIHVYSILKEEWVEMNHKI